MKIVNLCLLVSCGLGTLLATSGCLQDYDEFDFGAGGAPPATSAETTGPGPATTGTGQTNTTATSTVGPTTTNTTNTTNTTAQTTTASTTTASTTSGGPPIECGASMCDGATENCCVDGSANGSCAGNCPGNEITVECDSAADCDVGEICCLHESGGTDSVLCETTCDGFDNDPLCGGDGDAACASPTTCTDVGDLPGGYQSCQ